jgi:hypothetical protein
VRATNTTALAAAGVDTGVQLILSSVVPYPWDASLPIVAQYLSDMQTYASQADIGFSSLEGYIEASFAEQVLDLLPTSGNQTGEAFVDAIYSRELFAFQGLRFGPFGNTVCTRNTYVVLTSSSIFAATRTSTTAHAHAPPHTHTHTTRRNTRSHQLCGRQAGV